MAETIGSLVDKLSIVELKIYHMREQAERPDKPQSFRDACLGRIAVMHEQRDDLADELTALVADIAAGRRVPKVYRQFKMYNDPAYRGTADAAGAPAGGPATGGPATGEAKA